MKEIITLSEFKNYNYYIMKDRDNSSEMMYEVIDVELMKYRINIQEVNNPKVATWITHSIFTFARVYEINKEDNPEYFL